MLRQTLSQKMLQKLSPQQIQLMKLLQIPTATLEERIKEELETNPALEVGDTYQEVFDVDGGNEKEESNDNSEDGVDYELDDYLTQYLEDDPASYKTRDDSYGEEEEDRSMPVPVEVSFHDNLMRQLGMVIFEKEEDEIIAKQIIGSIDEDGYLRREPSAIVDDLMFSQSIEVGKDDVNRLLKIIQKFDPQGIGARDLRECLMIQLEDRLQRDPKDRNKKLALEILKNNFDEFIKKHYPKLKKTYSLSEFELKEVIEEILKLNPKPASGLEMEGKPNVQYIIPDFIITNKDGELELTLNSKNAPDLKISEHFAEMLLGYKENIKTNKASKTEKEAILFIKQKIDSAKWFIDAIRQRQETLTKTMYSILRFQYEYFLTGDERRLRPMILKDIADMTGLDISTVSRVANSKFLQTEFGTKRLKDFFSESIQTQDGQEVSTLEVKNILNEIISRENKKKPHSDEKLKELLHQRGYNIARRTVAKYRELLNVPVARLRKTL
ncbi:MAG: RNA polymerase factor sigma-54 [Saprospiraceae bacterium]|nr:RNA polymerase factor sigma-54 [Saprospiraceae bacterium]